MGEKEKKEKNEEGWVRTKNTSDAVHDAVNLLFTNRVVTTGIVVGGIFLAVQQVFGMVEGTVFSGPDLVNGRRVKIEEDGSGNIFATASFGKEGVVGASLRNVLGVGVGPAVGPKAVLEEIAMVV